MRDIHRIRPLDDGNSQEWERRSDFIGSVGACKIRGEDEWAWQVFIHVAEALDAEPIESLLVDVVTDALSSVRGVTRVNRDDREVWIVDGRPRGRALTAAAASAVESIRPQLEQALAELPTAQ